MARARQLSAQDPAPFFSKYMTKDLRRLITSTMEENERAWRQGRSIQRRQQTILNPLMWQAHTGIEPERLRLGDNMDPEAMFLEGPNADRFIDLAAMAVVGSLLSGAAQGQNALYAAVQLPTIALFIYMAARRFGTPNVFDLRNNLAEKLLLTDVDQIRPADVQPPFPGFYVQMPPGALEMFNAQTGWHKTTFVGIAEAVFTNESGRRGRGLASIFWSEPNENSAAPEDDNAQVSFVSLPMDYDGTIEQYESTIEYDGTEGTRQQFVKWQGRPLGFEEGHKLLRRFMVNFCLYLSSPNPDIQPTSGKQSWKDVSEQVGEARAQRSKRPVTVGKNFSMWDVGRNVHRLVRLTATDILVRGHWRRQAHGAGRALRKVIWIEPFVRRPTEGAEATGHDYAVENERELKRNGADLRDLARRISERISPHLGRALGQEVANNAAGVFVDPEMTDPVSTVVEQVLRQRMRHPVVYGAQHVDEDTFLAAIAAVEDLVP